MQRRSTGSASEEEGDDSRSNVGVKTPGDGAGGFATKLLDLQAGKELKNSLQSTARPRNTHELDRRKSIDRKPVNTRSRRPSSTNWKPSEARNATIDSRTSAERVVVGVPSKDAIEGDKMADSRSNIRRARLRSPWSTSVLILVTTTLAALALFSIIHSFSSRQLESKGCRMSYMRPSFAKLSDFDTEHTRFASKYSVYLYREGMIDEDTKVGMEFQNIMCRKGR